MSEITASQIKEVVRDFLLQEQPTFLTREQTTSMLSIGNSTLRRYVQENLFTEYRLGMRCYYNKTEILAKLINSAS